MWVDIEKRENGQACRQVRNVEHLVLSLDAITHSVPSGTDTLVHLIFYPHRVPNGIAPFARRLIFLGRQRKISAPFPFVPARRISNSRRRWP